MSADIIPLPLAPAAPVHLADLPPGLFQRLACQPIRVRVVDGTVQAGFPSPADDFNSTEIDLTRVLIPHPQATFMVRASGPSMIGAGINDGDVLLVDRALEAAPGHIVVAVIDADFTVKYLRRRAGRIYLEAANPTYPPIFPRDGQALEIWGVVTSAITRFVGR
jgi:DNA polymerase V